MFGKLAALGFVICLVVFMFSCGKEPTVAVDRTFPLEPMAVNPSQVGHLHNEIIRSAYAAFPTFAADTINCLQFAEIMIGAAKDVATTESLPDPEMEPSDIYCWLSEVAKLKMDGVFDFTSEAGLLGSDPDAFLSFCLNEGAITSTEYQDIVKILDDTNWILTTDSLTTDAGREFLATRDSSAAFWIGEEVMIERNHYSWEDEAYAISDAFGTIFGGLIGLAGGPVGGLIGSASGRVILSTVWQWTVELAPDYDDSDDWCPGCPQWF